MCQMVFSFSLAQMRLSGWARGRGEGQRSHCRAGAAPPFSQRRDMSFFDERFKYQRRSRLSPITTILDIADYKVGWIFSMRPFVTIIKIKTSKVMETPKYVTIIKIFGTEYRKA